MKRRTATKPAPPALPTPAKYDSRICFGIAYFTTEADAQAYALHVRKIGLTYNGGYLHGMPCGREESRDYTDPVLGPLFAVTH